MRMRSVVRAAACAAIVAAAGSAQGQLITGITKPTFGTNAPEVYYTNITNGQSQFLYNPEGVLPATAPGFGGLAADEAGRRLFASVRNGPDDDIYSIAYNGFSPTLVGEVRAAGRAIAIDGLAYDTSANFLYGTKRLGGTTGAEGIYRISTVDATAELVFTYEATGSLWDISAIDYDPVTRLMYLVDEDVDGGTGIFSFDPNNAAAGLTFVSALAAGVTDVDGLGAGGGKLYLVSDSDPDGNGGLHAVFNLLTGQYEQGLPSPYPAYTLSSVFGRINPSAAGAFAPGIPAPGGVAALVLGGVMMLRRRR